MADSPFASLGLEFMRWQNAPSLTGGAFEKLAGGAKKALLAKAAEGSGLVEFLDSIGQQPAGVAPPAQPGMSMPMAPAIPTVPGLPPIPQLGQPMAQQEQEEPIDFNEMIWGKK